MAPGALFLLASVILTHNLLDQSVIVANYRGLLYNKEL